MSKYNNTKTVRRNKKINKMTVKEIKEKLHKQANNNGSLYYAHLKRELNSKLEVKRAVPKKVTL